MAAGVVYCAWGPTPMRYKTDVSRRSTLDVGYGSRGSYKRL